MRTHDASWAFIVQNWILHIHGFALDLSIVHPLSRQTKVWLHNASGLDVVMSTTLRRRSESSMTEQVDKWRCVFVYTKSMSSISLRLLEIPNDSVQRIQDPTENYLLLEERLLRFTECWSQCNEVLYDLSWHRIVEAHLLAVLLDFRLHRQKHLVDRFDKTHTMSSVNHLDHIHEDVESVLLSSSTSSSCISDQQPKASLMTVILSRSTELVSRRTKRPLLIMWKTSTSSNFWTASSQRWKS